MRRLTTLSLALVLLFLLTACGGDNDTIPGSEWNDYEAGLPTEPEPDPADREPLPERVLELTLAYHRDATLDPVTCGEGIQQDVASLLFEPLFQLNGQFEPEPLLCESYSWNDTGLVCTLTLRGGVTFQDGSPLTARDVSATIQRAMASQRYAYRLRNVASVSANYSGQVVVTLRAPDQGLPALLDIPIVKRGTENQTVPVGTGPYVLTTDGGESALRRNPSWWQGKALPLETIPLVHAKDRSTAMYQFSIRRVGLLTVDPTDDADSVTGQSEMTDRPTTILQYVCFNTAQGRLFADANLRSIFSRGIPRDTLVNAQLAGLALPAQFPVSPLSPLYPTDRETAYDQDAVLTALRSAGQDTGTPRELVLLVNQEDNFRLTSARYIAESLSLLDWHITVQELPWEDYLAALTAGNFDLCFGEVRLTADWDLTDLIGTGGALNYGRYADPDTDTLLAAFAAAGDRQTAAAQLMARLQTEAPIAPVCFNKYTVLTHPHALAGLAPTATTTFYGMEGWSLPEEP